ncbi:MAG: polysaccharide biosynthesis/export family protein [Rhodobacteraceae bacterium]|jgi:polysaccharide export outer membrane protein|nr:polysaccharide biosynthesis/export family protein [Paracoccaceae bacterium]
MRKAILALVAVLVSASVAVAQDYRVRPGDTLTIEVLEDPGLNRSVLVLPDGSFSFPFAGNTSAGGRSVAEIQSSLTSSLAPNFAAPPNVTVSVGALAQPSATGASVRTMPVYVIGEVATPGKIDVRRGTTLLQFLAESGGFTRFAATNRVQLRRGDSVVGFNYRDALRGGSIGAGATVLQPGDVVIVPERRLFE